MYCTRKVTEDLYWIGANDHRLHLFENIHPIPRGVSWTGWWSTIWSPIMEPAWSRFSAAIPT